LIDIQVRIPDGWLPIRNARLISNHYRLARLIDVHEGIPYGWLSIENVELIDNMSLSN
jgi:formyltetrahydrofolate hydrolase